MWVCRFYHRLIITGICYSDFSHTQQGKALPVRVAYETQLPVPYLVVQLYRYSGTASYYGS